MIVSGRVKKNMDAAVKLILDGQVVAFPTETVYGLGADALNASAVESIFKVKGRPFNDPLIVHIADREQLEILTQPLKSGAQDWADKLILKFWPGPLTLIFKKRKIVPDLVTGGLDTVAIRMPRHLIARALIKNCERPIAAPSANRFQSLSPTTAMAVSQELGDRVSLILDGGPCEVGLESTVISLVGTKPVILRPGGVGVEDIQDVLGFEVEVWAKAARGGGSGELGKILSPGLLDFHYSPKKSLKYFELDELRAHVKGKRIKRKLAQVALLCFSRFEEKIFNKEGFFKIYVLSPRGNLDEAARELFQTLRIMDEDESQSLYALKCPDEKLGRALNDRLTKAEH